MTVAIIDYGSGNLRSAAKALERAAAAADLAGKVCVTDKAADLSSATHVVLPGVGAFGDCSAGLARLPGMMEALESAVIAKARPFLGICVGMQLMAEAGTERGRHRGLRWLGGAVVPIAPDRNSLKIPHMGWNELILDAPAHPIFAGIPAGAHAYFVHSYHFAGAAHGTVLATVDYGGLIAAVVGRDNMVGAQFHPEKSQTVGMKFLTNFLEWRP